MTSRGPIWPVLGGNGQGGDPPAPGGDPAGGAPKPGPPGGQEPDWKALYDAEVAAHTETKGHSRKHEDREKANKDTLAKVLDALGVDADGKATPEALAQEAVEQAQSSVKDANDRAEAAERKSATLQAIVDNPGLDKDDLELLEAVPVDKVAEVAKKLAERIGGDTPPKGPRPPKPNSHQGGGGSGNGSGAALGLAEAQKRFGTKT